METTRNCRGLQESSAAVDHDCADEGKAVVVAAHRVGQVEAARDDPSEVHDVHGAHDVRDVHGVRFRDAHGDPMDRDPRTSHRTLLDVPVTVNGGGARARARPRRGRVHRGREAGQESPRLSRSEEMGWTSGVDRLYSLWRMVLMGPQQVPLPSPGSLSLQQEQLCFRGKQRRADEVQKERVQVEGILHHIPGRPIAGRETVVDGNRSP